MERFTSPDDFDRYSYQGRNHTLWVSTLDHLIKYNSVIAKKISSNADSVVKSVSDGLNYFVKPFEKEEDFSEFLSHLLEQEPDPANSFVRYSQTRTTCLLWPHRFISANQKLSRE